VFACQQFTWLFSTAFLRNPDAVQQTISLLSSNPDPVGPEAYNRQAQAYLRHDAFDRLADVESPTLVIVGEQVCSRRPGSAARWLSEFHVPDSRSSRARDHRMWWRSSVRTSSTTW
jgi:hypothetical protein